MTRAVFLDRDGVLNHVRMDEGIAASPRNAAELIIESTASDQLARLRAAGFLTLLVTNQPDVGRGTLDVREAEKMNAHVARELRLDGSYMCTHDNADGCACRKPLPGLLHTAINEHGLDASQSWLIGDRWVDVAAGAAASVRTILLERTWSWAPTSAGAADAQLQPTRRGDTLQECVDIILAEDQL